MAVTQQDIAKRLGVSQRLVSYALNGHACVGEEMRQRIKEQAEELGYRPHRAAQALVTGRTYQIALCLPMLGSSFNNEIIRQFEMLARPSAYDLLMVTFDPYGTSSKVRFTADGTIFVGAGFHVPSSIPEPVVVLQNQLNMLPNANDPHDRIQLNTEHASYATMRHLIGQGLKRIAYVAPSGMIGDRDFRWFAYESCMHEAGLPLEIISLPLPGESLIRQQSHQLMRDHFLENGFPEAVFCCNDDVGMGAYRALKELGRKIPEGTAVVGFDDLDHARYQVPPMSSVNMPLETVCRRVWEVMMKRIEGGEFPPVHEQFDAHLVVRKSSTLEQ